MNASAMTWLLFAAADALLPFNVRVDYSPVVYDADGRLVAAYLSADDKWRFHTDNVPEALKQALMFKEDRRFYYHFGVDVLAVLRAAITNAVTRRRTSGASTITMQVVRLLHPGPRTYERKIFEAFYALRLEYRLSKRQILELYFNLLPFGGNIEGVEAAARFYFQKSVAALSPAQLTTLCVLPNRPNGLRPDKRGAELIKARNKWLEKFKSAKIWTEETLEIAKIEALTARRRPLGMYAKHLSRKLVDEARDAKSVASTLKLDLQIQAETRVKNYVQRLKAYRITNAAAVVVENQDRAVRAYVGSADFDDAATAGQVDGAAAVRSPGSALKPLIYALAIEKGLNPKRMLLDAPTNFGGFWPENYDRKYRGLVRAEDALAQSLNVPAVAILEKIGISALTQALSAAGFAQIEKDAKKLGLAAALGGCGVRPVEMAGLYAAFADGGRYRPIRKRVADPVEPPISLFSPETAQIVGEILRRRDRPDLPAPFVEAADAPAVSWKTGTSLGRRDAWACGYSQKYTVVVWTGNFDGEPSPFLTGTDVAAPLMFDLFSMLEPRHSSAVAAPLRLPKTEVCAYTGLPPGPFCHDKIFDVYVAPSRETCDHRKEYWVSNDGKTSYCMECLPEKGAEKRIYDHLPAEWTAYFEREGIKHDFPPPHNPQCSKLGASQTKIVFPTHGAEIFTTTAGQRLRAQAHADARAHHLHWFVDERYVGATVSGESPPLPHSDGKIKLTVRDDLGGKHSVEFKVKSAGR